MESLVYLFFAVPMLVALVLIFIVLPIAVIRWLWRNSRK